MRIAIGQMRVVPGEPSTNLQTARRFVQEAGEEGADVVVLPECLDLGWTDESAAELADPVPGVRSDALARAAAEAGIFVVAGLTERGNDGRCYNVSVLIDRKGALLGTHQKINILDIATGIYSAGRRLQVISCELGQVAIPICADCLEESIEIPRALGRMGATMILSPSAWAVPPGYDNDATPYGADWIVPYTDVATAYGLTVVGVSNVGRIQSGSWAEYPCIGSSLIVTPGGVSHQSAFGENAEVLDVVDVDDAITRGG